MKYHKNVFMFISIFIRLNLHYSPLPIISAGHEILRNDDSMLLSYAI